MKTRHGSTPRSREIAVYAVFLLGGTEVPVDTEDVAMKMNELAPGRFTWNKYADQVNLELVRVAASDAKKGAHGGLLQGSGRNGWRLTEAGKTWLRKNGRTFSDGALPPHRMVVSREARFKRAERTRLIATEAYRKAHSGVAVTEREAEAFFRIDPYVEGEKRQERINRILRAFANDPELGPIALHLSERVRNS